MPISVHYAMNCEYMIERKITSSKSCVVWQLLASIRLSSISDSICFLEWILSFPKEKHEQTDARLGNRKRKVPNPQKTIPLACACAADRTGCGCLSLGEARAQECLEDHSSAVRKMMLATRLRLGSTSGEV